MEFDKTQLTHDVATAVWASLDPLGLEAPFEEQNSMIQYNLKAQILPIVSHTLKATEGTFKATVLDKIKSGQDNGLSSDEIIWSLQMELAD